MIEKLREFVNQSHTTTDVGSLIVNRQLTILAVTEIIPTWLDTPSAGLIRQPLTAVFPELNGYDTLLQEVIAKNDPRLTMHLSNIVRSHRGHNRPQSFQLEAQCTPRPGFLLITMNTTPAHTVQSDIEQQVQQRTAELVQANILLEWELEQLKKHSKNNRPTPTPTVFFPQIGFG